MDQKNLAFHIIANYYIYDRLASIRFSQTFRKEIVKIFEPFLALGFSAFL
jgi:hypothetical protein